MTFKTIVDAISHSFNQNKRHTRIGRFTVTRNRFKSVRRSVFTIVDTETGRKFLEFRIGSTQVRVKLFTWIGNVETIRSRTVQLSDCVEKLQNDEIIYREIQVFLEAFRNDPEPMLLG